MLLESILEVPDLSHKALFEFVLTHLHLRLLVSTSCLFVSFGSCWLAHSFDVHHLLLLFQVLQWLVVLLLRSLWWIDLLDKVRKPLHVLACRVLHALVARRSASVDLRTIVFHSALRTIDKLCLVRAKLKMRLEQLLLWRDNMGWLQDLSLRADRHIVLW